MEKEGHPDYAPVDVTTGTSLLDGKAPDVVMNRFDIGHGVSYQNSTPEGLPPVVIRNGRETSIPEA